MEADPISALSFARHSLIAYAIAQWEGYQAFEHHHTIAKALEAVERGDIKRLMIFVPPRHGKSMLASEYFPAWYIGRNPSKYIICATYAQELADDFGRKVRNQLSDDLHHAIFPECRISTDSAAASRFSTQSGGSYFAVGVGGPITGRGAHLLLIDDPIKNRQDADSEIKQRTSQDWYKSVARTRLMPNGAIVVIQTRWNENDLAGWLLSEHSHEAWTVIDLPAVKNDLPLWPEAYPLEELETIRKSIGSREWNALYMQNPMPDEGDFFKREWFRWYEDAPKHLNKYGTSDYAVTQDGGDWTEHGVFGVSPDNDVYALDWWSGQTTADIWIETQIDLMEIYDPFIWAGESGPIRRSIEPFLLKRMNDRRKMCRIEWLPSITDKPSRARSFQALCSMGKFYLPKKPWAEEIVNQLIRFPAGAIDDKVDTCSLLGRLLDQVWKAHKPKEKQKFDMLAQPTLNDVLNAQTKTVRRRI